MNSYISFTVIFKYIYIFFITEYTEHSKLEGEPHKEQPEKKEHVKPVIDRCRPIAQQCREALIEGAGEKLIQGIFTKSHKLKKHSVLLLHDFVQFGEVSYDVNL